MHDVAERICTIALNRPEKSNAWRARAGADPEVGAIILTGSSRGFCAAPALQGGSRLPEFEMAHAYFPAIPKFIMAAINGAAAGLGFVIPVSNPT